MGKYQRRINANSGLDAFSKSYGITQQVMRDYKAHKAEGEITTLGSDAGAVEGEGYTVTAPDGTTSQGLVSRDSGADFDAIQQAYGEQGYTVERQEKPMYAARAGEGKDYGLHDTAAAAEAGSRKANHGLMRQKADVYQKHGMREEAGGMRREARAGERQDSQDAMAMTTHTQQTALNDIKLDEAKTSAAARERTGAFYTEANENPPQSPQAWQALARKHNLPLDEQWKVLGGVAKIDTEMYQQVQAGQLRAFDAEARQSEGSLDALLDKTYNDEKNPLWADGRTASIARDKDGVRVLDDSGRVIMQGGSDAEVMAGLRAQLQDPGTAFQFQRNQAEFKMKQAESAAKVRKDNAAAANGGGGNNTTIYTGAPIALEGGGLGRLTKAGGAPVPIPGALDPNKAVVTKAENALAGVSRQVDPPSPDNPNPAPYYLRNGEKIPAFVRGKPNPEYTQIQGNAAKLREAGKVPPWERKQQPGLK